MTTETHVTLARDPDTVVEHPQEGAMCHGIFLEGARWGANGFIEDEPEDFYEVREDLILNMFKERLVHFPFYCMLF